MNPYDCDNEPKVLEALRSGVWEIGLRDHVNHCSHCADALVVAEFLQQEAALAGTPPTLPSAGFLWWKSQLLAREMAVKQATRSIVLVRNLAIVICSAALLWFFSASAQAYQRLLGPLKDQQVLWAGDLRAVVLLGVAGAVACAVLGSLYFVWVDK